MRRAIRSIVVLVSVAAAIAMLAENAGAQHRRRPVRRGAVVFVGGYFYDPFFGPYPWWQRTAYPFPYYPVYDNRAEVRVNVRPTEAAVYVDGFYAGIVDDFNGFFERLPLPAGGHEIVLYLDGYRTVRQRVYLGPRSTFTLELTLERLPPGERSEPPVLAPPIPPPPEGSFIAPRTPAAAPVATSGVSAGVPAVPHGTLALRVQPARADVVIDGERWASSDIERVVLQLPAGPHRIEVSKAGYRTFSTEIELRADETTPLNVSLMPETRD